MLVKKGYIGFVGSLGSQPALLLLHQLLGKHQKAITQAVTPVTPQILRTLFYSQNFFTSICHHKNKKTFSASVSLKPCVILT